MSSSELSDEDGDSPVDVFAASLARLDVPLVRVASDDAPSTLAGLVEAPAVGTPLPGRFGFALPDGVRTDFSPADLRTARTGVTHADFAVADYGSVALPATPEGLEPASLFGDRHVVVLRADDVLPDMPAAFDRLGPRLREGDSCVLATGPSATADMGALVRGAHGPKSVHVVLVEGDGGD
jgi:L-lactate dehydrogenase complex protein LldG